MALIAHYRLDGNADDAFGKFNGVARNVTWAAGKLGGAGDFVSGNISTDVTTELMSQCSLAFWIFNRGGGGSDMIGSAAAAGADRSLNVYRYPTRQDFHWSTGNSNGIDAGKLPYGEWTHVVLTSDGSKICRYYNGVLHSCSRGSVKRTAFPIRIGANRTAALLDDVRIYDHALSVREVRDLAMGLAVHYPMMDFQEPTKNLYPMPAVEGNYFTNAFNGQYGYGVNTNAQWVVDNSDQPVAGLPVQKVSRIESDVSQFLYLQWESMFPAKSLAPGQSVTISFWYYGTYGTSIMPYIGGGTGGVVFAGSGGASQVIAVPVRQWHRVSFTLTNPTSETKTYGYGWMRLHYNTEIVALSNQEFWKFTAVQSELKSYPTEYTQGVRSARVVDTSGQGADAPLALTTTPKWIEESPTGRGAYDFSAPNHCVAIPDTKENYHDGFTLACWAYKRGAGGGNWGRLLDKSTTTSALGGFFLYSNGSQLAFGIANGSAPLACAIPTAQWFHVVVTVDVAGNACIYRDGGLVHTAVLPAPSQILTSNPLTIGNRSTASDRHWDGLVSDFRFYSASITAEQVKELYQQRASLDSEGNLYASLLREAVGYKFVWDNVQPFPTGNLFSGVIQNNCLRITTTHSDPALAMYNLGSFDPAIYKVVQYKYRVISGTAGSVQVYFTNAQYRTAHGEAMVSAALVSDGDWHVANVMMASHAKWGDSNITGWRLDPCTAAGVTMEIAWVRLVESKNDLSVQKTITVNDVSEVGITDGLVAYYPLTKDAKDYSGNEYDGVVNGAVPVAGGFDGKGAFGFDGVDDYINLDVSHAAQVEITMSLWMAVGTASLNAGVLTQRRAGIESKGIFTVGNKIGAFSRNSSGTWQHVEATAPFVPGQYYHAVLVQTGSVISLFVDGTLRQTRDMGSFATGYGGFFRVGNYTDANLPYQGNICNIKIFNRALTAQEIAVEYKRTGPTKMTQHQGVTYIQGEIKEV